MNKLPPELSQHILKIALDVHPVPSNILRVNKDWNEYLTPVLHGNIRLYTLTQLYRFITTGRLTEMPKSFSIRLAGGFSLVHFTGTAKDEGTLEAGIHDTADKPDDLKVIKMKILDKGGIWGCLKEALLKCNRVESVVLQMHSFVSDPNLPRITNCLGIIK